MCITNMGKAMSRTPTPQTVGTVSPSVPSSLCMTVPMGAYVHAKEARGDNLECRSSGTVPFIFLRMA